MNSLLSMVTPEPEMITCPSFLQVMRMGMSPEETTHGMYSNCPMEAGGNSKGWMSGGTAERRGGEGGSPGAPDERQASAQPLQGASGSCAQPAWPSLSCQPLFPFQ